MERILIIDYGSQFTQLIARVVRDAGVFCEIHPPDAALPDADGFILSGGPQSTTAANAVRIDDAIFAANKPMLGVCYGMQAMMMQLGGEMEDDGRREYGGAILCQMEADCPLWDNVPEWDDTPADDGVPYGEQTVWMSHGDHVVRPADGFRVVAKSEDGVIAAVENAEKRWYGLQFHPEVDHTISGRIMLRNFLQRVCGLSCNWTMPNFITRATEKIRTDVGGDGVLLALSGGVDSAVAAALLHRAIGKQLTCVLVDNGLLRDGEADSVREVFERQFGMKLIVVDAAERFFAALAGVSEPEEKRKIIGRLFIEVFEEEAKKLPDNVRWLAQGTIYPDVVESAKTGSGKAVIKTHHNVGGLPERLHLNLLEPLRELFKDEVRRLGRELGLTEELTARHPFPGPGLAVRVLGEVTAARAETARRADKIFIDELRRGGSYGDAAQAFAVLLPVNSVGVMGDARTYENVVALRAVTTDNFMTADWARLPSTLLARVATRIINEVRGVNRVVYDISSKPPATVEWE